MNWLINEEGVQPSAAAAFENTLSLLRAFAAQRMEEIAIRVYTPPPAVAITRREVLLPGFDTAVDAARLQGYEAVVRPTGGRAAALNETCLVIEVMERTDRNDFDHKRTFERRSGWLAKILRDLGVDARVGRVNGEYCPGDFSINARGTAKLVGTAQRAIQGALLYSAVIPLGETAQLVDVLVPVNRALDLDWDPRTFGSVGIELGTTSTTLLRSAIVNAIAPFATSITSADLLDITTIRRTAEDSTQQLDCASYTAMSKVR